MTKQQPMITDNVVISKNSFIRKHSDVATMTVAAMTARWNGMRKDSRHADDQTRILLQLSRRRIIHLKNER